LIALEQGITNTKRGFPLRVLFPVCCNRCIFALYAFLAEYAFQVVLPPLREGVREGGDTFHPPHPAPLPSRERESATKSSDAPLCPNTVTVLLLRGISSAKEVSLVSCSSFVGVQLCVSYFSPQTECQVWSPQALHASAQSGVSLPSKVRWYSCFKKSGLTPISICDHGRISSSERRR